MMGCTDPRDLGAVTDEFVDTHGRTVTQYSSGVHTVRLTRADQRNINVVLADYGLFQVKED